MELIKFMYRKYYKIDAACTTTTATTTTSTTTTKEPSTSQSFSSDSVTSKTLTSDSLTSQSVTSDLEITETTNGTSTFGSFISESTTNKLGKTALALMCMGIPPCFSPICTKGDNFCAFLFAFANSFCLPR